MTASPFKKHDNTGRSTSSLKPNKRGKLKGPFVQLSEELLSSPAWLVLTNSDRKVLDRIMIEHMAHGGTENGNLKCTYDNFVEYGVRRPSVADSIRRLKALGFIEIVERGRITRAEFKFPSIYRLTFVQGNIAATDEWKRIKDQVQTKRIVGKVSKSRIRDRRCRKNRKPDTEPFLKPDTEPFLNFRNPGYGWVTQGPDTEASPLYISMGNMSAVKCSNCPTERIQTARMSAVVGSYLLGCSQQSMKGRVHG